MDTIVISYLIIINLLTVIMFGRDKRRATHHNYRISEKQLYWLLGLGGVVGGLVGMQLFRHKTIKSSFIIRFAIITFVWIVIAFILLFH